MEQKIKTTNGVEYAECMNPWDESWNNFKGYLVKVDEKQKMPYHLDGVERGFWRIIDRKGEVMYTNKLYIKIN